MISHLAKFSAFFIVVMMGFALAFHALFYTCERTEDGEDLMTSFGTFARSLLTTFEAMLGSFDFRLFEEAADECALPPWAYDTGVWMLAVYLVVMVILLLNLLIAVLSTAHTEVYKNAEKEFHLARAKLILQSSRAVARRRLPPPLNLVKLVLAVFIDLVYTIYRPMSG